MALKSRSVAPLIVSVLGLVVAVGVMAGESTAHPDCAIERWLGFLWGSVAITGLRGVLRS